MLVLDDTTIRSCFVNATRRELADLVMPNLRGIDWDRLDYLGWRDPRLAKRAYIVVPLADGPVGIVLKQAEAAPRSRAQCSWCQDITLPNDVVLYGARRSGAAGRNGDTVGTLICSDFECSANVRKLPPSAYLGYDVEAARGARIDTLRTRSGDFATGIVEAG
jgi:hypothetical protein